MQEHTSHHSDRDPLPEDDRQEAKKRIEREADEAHRQEMLKRIYTFDLGSDVRRQADPTRMIVEDNTVGVKNETGSTGGFETQTGETPVISPEGAQTLGSEAVVASEVELNPVLGPPYPSEKLLPPGTSAQS